MSMKYLENPILLVNSRGPFAASGRNVRAKHRTRQAAEKIQSETRQGQFGFFEIDPKPGLTQDEKAFLVDKGSKRSSHVASRNGDVDVVALQPNKARRKDSRAQVSLPEAMPQSIGPARDLPTLLEYAALHIRVLATKTTASDQDRLKHILLCRQWSCVYTASERLGKSAVLDSAFCCVAARVNRLYGVVDSSYSDVTLYNEALSNLQFALNNPGQHDLADLRMSAQSLALYEMLESLDSSGWQLHISGAKLLNQPQPVVLDINQSSSNPRQCARTVPMITEALLTGKDKLFEENWKSLLLLSQNNYESLNGVSSGLATSMLDLPMLISDMRTLCSISPGSFDHQFKYSLLDRAHLLQARIRSSLLNNDQRLDITNKKIAAFDVVSLYLAALIALDHMIASLQAANLAAQRFAEEKTAELCERMLQLDLGANGAYAAFDLMKAFSMSTLQEQPGYIIAFPGREGW